MFKLKTPLKVGISRLVQYKLPNQLQLSFDAHEGLKNTTEIKSEIKQNEIVSDKFRKQLPNIVERNKTPVKYQPLERKFISSTAGTGQEQSDSTIFQLTNITDGALPISNNSKTPIEGLENGSNEESNHVSLKKVLNSSLQKESPIKANITSVLTEKTYDQIVLEKNKLQTQVDLATALVPLSLHSRENDLLVDSIVQDVHELYYKTVETINLGCLIIQNRSRVCYIELDKFLKQPDTPQNFVREQVMSQLSIFKEKTAIWLCEAKEPPTEKKPEKPVAAAESPVEKIKKAIENIVSSVKKMMEEMKKKAEEAKQEKK